MRPTRRGVAAAVVAAVALGMGAQFGAPALNALVVPIAIGFLIGAVQLVRAPAPAVERSEPAPGFPGEVRDMALRTDARLPCDLTEPVGDGLRVEGVAVGPPDASVTGVGPNEADIGTVQGGAAAREAPDAGRVLDDSRVARATLPGAATVRVRCRLTARGVRETGPARISLRDSLGLLHRETTVPGTSEALVYPDVVPLTDASALAAVVERATADERAAFDELREYVPGDPLRDVDWKASAKQPAGDLVVTEYAAQDQGGLTVVGEAAPGCTDEMASAVASVVGYLLDANLLVEVAVPDGECHVGGESDRDRALELLARTGPGEVEREAGIRVQADRNGTRVRIDGRTVPFGRLAGGADDRATADRVVGEADAGDRRQEVRP